MSQSKNQFANKEGVEINRPNNATLLSKIERLEKKSNKTFKNLDNLLDQTIAAIQEAQMEIQQTQNTTEDILNNLHNKMTVIKPLSNLHTQFNNLYKTVSGVYKYVQQLQPPINLNLLKVQPIFSQQELRIIEEGIGDHFLREKKYELAQLFMTEQFQNRKKLYQECELLKQSIKRGELDEAIQWIDQVKFMGKEKIIGYELKKAKIIYLAKNEKGQEALAYYKQSMPMYVDIRDNQITLMMGYILAYSKEFWADESQLTEMLRKRHQLLDNYDLQQLADKFQNFYYESNGLNLENPVVRCYKIGRKYRDQIIQQITKLPPSQQIPKILPISIHIDDEDKYHSQFFCPINKELYTSEQKCVILKCGHMISFAALGKINESRNSRRKLRCPICQKEHQADEYTQVQF